MHDTIYFVSDLHLGAGTQAEEDKKKEKFIRFLQLVRQDGKALYIVGDLFDFWFEYKNAIPKTDLEILVALKNLTLMELPVVYLTGNHDYWHRDFFSKYLGIKIEKGDLVLSHEGQNVFITHGDGKARSDWGYRIIKALFRHPLDIWLYRLLPVDWAFPLARQVSGSSRRMAEGKEKERLPEYEQFARGKFAEGFDAVIFAHSHWPERKSIEGRTILNIGDFMYHFTYGALKGKEFQLLKLE